MPVRRAKPRFLFAIAVLLPLLVLAGVLYPWPRGGEKADRGARLETYQQLERVGLALQHFHQERGNYPSTLSELVPQHLASLPQDPYVKGSGGLKYLSDVSGGQRSLLYSIGPDGIDQGGVSIDPLTGRGDVVYPVD